MYLFYRFIFIHKKKSCILSNTTALLHFVLENPYLNISTHFHWFATITWQLKCSTQRLGLSQGWNFSPASASPSSGEIVAPRSWSLPLVEFENFPCNHTFDLIRLLFYRKPTGWNFGPVNMADFNSRVYKAPCNRLLDQYLLASKQKL